MGVGSHCSEATACLCSGAAAGGQLPAVPSSTGTLSCVSAEQACSVFKDWEQCPYTAINENLSFMWHLLWVYRVCFLNFEFFIMSEDEPASVMNILIKRIVR